MAYALLYNFKWTDTGSNDWEFEIYQDGFAGSSESISYSATSPLSVRMRGDQEDADNIINGQEFNFTIVVDDPADRNKYDTLFESDFKDFYGQYKKNGTVVNKGWLKPENLEKDAENPIPRITLSFTDGLADLKDIEFRETDGSFYEGEMTMIGVIKEALSKIGTTVAARDFRIVNNMYEFNEMTTDANGFPNDSFLRVSDIDTRRFISYQGGKAKADDCYTVIEKVLKDFNSKLRVVNDQYWIVHYQESAYADANYTNGETLVHEILWSDLTATGHSRSSLNNALDLGGQKYRRGGNLTKLPPLKGYDLTFKNKYLGSIPDATVNDWSNWTVSGAVSNSIDADGTITVGVNTHDFSCYLESPTFLVSQETPEDYLKIVFDHIFSQFVSGSIGNTLFYVEVIKPFDRTSEGNTQYFGDTWDQYFSPNTETFRVSHNVPVTDPDSYQLRIRIAVNPHTMTSESVEVKLTQPSVRKIILAASSGGGTNAITLDKNFIIEQAGGVKIEEIETVFGDAENTYDLGRIEINGNLTTTWNHLKNFRQPLLEQYLRHKLNNRQSYADIRRFQYLDTDDDISIEKVLKIGSDYYEIIGFRKEYRQGNTTLTVRQIFTSDVSYTLSESKLNASDGESTQGDYTNTTGSTGGTSGGSTSGPTFNSEEFYQTNDFWFDSQYDFNYSNVSTDRTLFSLYNDDLGGTSNLLASLDYDFTNDAFKVVNTDLSLSGNDITNINNIGGGGTPIGVNDDLNFGGTSDITNLNTFDFGGTSVNEISTTIDGTSTNSQLVTAAAVNNLVTALDLQAVTEQGNTTDQDIVLANNTKYKGTSSGGSEATLFYFTNTDNLYIGDFDNLAGTVYIRQKGVNAITISGTQDVSLSSGPAVDEIVTTVDGTSADDQLPTAAAVNDRITGWGLEDARGAGNTMLGDVSITGNNTLQIGDASVTQIPQLRLVSDLKDFQITSRGSGISEPGFLGIYDVTESAYIARVNADNFGIYSSNFSLPAGTSVNEIVTSIDGTSTDDQLPTAAAVNTVLNSYTLEDARSAGNTLSGDIDFAHNSLLNPDFFAIYSARNDTFFNFASDGSIEFFVDIGASSIKAMEFTSNADVVFASNRKIYKTGHSGWTQVSTSGLYYKILPDNTVMLHGYVEATGTGGNTTVDLPTEARPASQWYIVGGLNSASIYPIRIESTGEIVIQTGTWSAGQQLQIDGIMYELERT